ncbi:hypothetical protein J6590_042468 [Homalodisca vitripennis]|nr:hypothetical protein J6590_042468 [Homalodisca vitripennis]
MNDTILNTILSNISPERDVDDLRSGAKAVSIVRQIRALSIQQRSPRVGRDNAIQENYFLKPGVVEDDSATSSGRTSCSCYHPPTVINYCPHPSARTASSCNYTVQRYVILMHILQLLPPTHRYQLLPILVRELRLPVTILYSATSSCSCYPTHRYQLLPLS